MPTKPQFKENYNIPATFSESTLLLRVFRAGDFVLPLIYYFKVLENLVRVYCTWSNGWHVCRIGLYCSGDEGDITSRTRVGRAGGLYNET